MEKTRFKSMYNHGSDHFRAPIGDKVVIRHRAKMKTDGKRDLVADVKYPIYEIIQSHREETEIERIVKRAIEGDYNALNAMKGVYADIADAPGSLAEAQAMIINAKNEFYDLPLEIREKFNQNAEEYVAEMGTPKWMDKMGITAELEKINNPTTENIDASQVADIANGVGQIVSNVGGDANE